ncbi:hypothetical protein [Haloprofundus salilacus]|uniref:hypothetical protein n=1 Tax=Haloprofundus salilacus TaxID=2876190 RepID=UPI001CCA2127|nr:hypothetical protein [Haloprofundus salilacus]
MKLEESGMRPNKLLRSLKRRNRWACFDAEKKPIDPESGDPVDVLRTRDHHMSYREANLAYADHDAPVGIGFSIGLDDELILIDLDDCLDDDLKFKSEVAEDIFTTVNSYTEISVGGHGLHILTSGYNLESYYGHSEEHPVEIYDGQKFFTFTGRHVQSPYDVKKQPGAIATIHRRYGPWVSYREWISHKSD